MVPFPQNVQVPSQQSLVFFFAGEPASAFEGSTGVAAGTGSLIKRTMGMEEEEAGNWVLELLVPGHLLVQFLLNRCSASCSSGREHS